MSNKTLLEADPLGLGKILQTRKLAMPTHQREYSWTKKEVTTLLTDFAEAMLESDAEYFLGTIVGVAVGNNTFEIVDGQQRLATTAIFLTAVRDYLKFFEPAIAATIDNEYLTVSSDNMRDREPRIRLNLVDNQFFADLLSGKNPRPAKPSHELLQTAYDLCLDQVKNIVKPLDQNKHGDALARWSKFLRDHAQVVFLTIGEDGNAYRMFETLNDRGLKTTQADLVKSYLFGRAGNRLVEAQMKWSNMNGSLDVVGDDIASTVLYLRHTVMLKRGYFRENTLLDKIKSDWKGQNEVIELLSYLDGTSALYAALFNPESEMWIGYPDALKDAIKTLNLLNIVSMRPLMLAVASKFSKNEAAKAFRKFVSWSVRYLIAGDTLTGGYIEVPLTGVAKRVFDGEITDEKSLSKDMLARLPNDETFEKEFSNATVSKPPLARYYLRALHRAQQGLSQPESIPNDDRETVTLEHVLPKNPMGNWLAFNEEQSIAYLKRIGNLVLLQAKKNSDLKSSSFAEKKKVFAESTYGITNQIATLSDWTPQAVVQRQDVLAKLALKAWPL